MSTSRPKLLGNHRLLIYINCCVLKVVLAFQLRNFEGLAMPRESVFAKMETVLFLFFVFCFQFRDSSGARGPGRSAEIVRFETLETFLTVDGKNTILFPTADG